MVYFWLSLITLVFILLVIRLEINLDIGKAGVILYFRHPHSGDRKSIRIL